MSLPMRLALLQSRGILFRPLILSNITRQCFSSGPVPVYHGPLAKTFRNVKIFSLTSFGLASAMTPLFFLIESALPTSAKMALAVTALGTSGISTALVGWCGAPYVSTLRRLPDGGGIEMETMTLFMKSRHTLVYDPSLFLRVTERPFAKWELAARVDKAQEAGELEEETVAETKDSDGRVLGRWIVKWNSEGKGECKDVGKVVRCVFSVDCHTNVY